MQLMYKHQRVAQSDVLIEVCISLLLLETFKPFLSWQVELLNYWWSALHNRQN